MSEKQVKLTPAQQLLKIHLAELDLEAIAEYQFYEDRRWRLDLAVPSHRLGFEISGGNWTGGHRRGEAQEGEYDKLNTAQAMGWRVFQFTNRQVLRGHARAWLVAWLSKDCCDDNYLERE